MSPAFVLSESNAHSVGTICRRLDGIPLALELAAARMRVLSAPQVAQRLDDRFRLLTGGSRTSLPRQQTLRATIDWSYEQLDAEEQSLLRGLGVFMGGWTLESAAAVCAGEGMDEFEILDLLTRLIEKSMVIVDHHGEDARYRLLETVRQYAREKLLEAGEGSALRDRHLAHYLHVTEGVTARLSGPDQERLVESLENDHENFQAAIDWAVGEKRAEDALTLVCALSHFWSLRSHHAEALKQFEAALAVEEADSSELRGAALCRASWCALVRGKVERAEDLAREGLEMASQFRDIKSQMVARVSLGALSVDRQDVRGAMEQFTSALELSRELGNLTGEAASLNNLGEVHFIAGELDRAKQLCEEALTIIHDIGDPHLEGWNLSCQGVIAIAQGELTSARSLLGSAFELFSRVGSLRQNCLTLSRMACLCSAEGQHELAAQLFGATDAMAERRRLHFEKVDQRFQEGHKRATMEAMGADAFEDMHATGRNVTEEDAFVLAFGRRILSAGPAIG